MQEFGQVWSGRVRQVKRAMSRMLLKRWLFSALTYHDLWVRWVQGVRCWEHWGRVAWCRRVEHWAGLGGWRGGQWAGGGRASQVAGKGAGGEPACGMQELPPVSSPPVSRQFLMLKTNNQILGSTFTMLNTYSKVLGSTNISHCYLMPNYEIFYFDSS